MKIWMACAGIWMLMFSWQKLKLPTRTVATFCRKWHADLCLNFSPVSEDVYDPTIDLSRVAEFCGSNKVLFKGVLGAEECVKEYAVVADDCQEVSVTTERVLIDKTSICDASWSITVNGATKYCDQTASETFTVLVNDAISTDACEFPVGKGPDVPPELDILNAINRCDGQIFSTLEEAEACVLRNSVGRDSAGGCRPVEVTVESEVNNCEVAITVSALRLVSFLFNSHSQNVWCC